MVMGRNTQLPRRRWFILGAVGIHVAVVLEMVIMATPFAAYYYAAYGPVLDFLNSSPQLFWLTEFFVTHLSIPDSFLLPTIQNVGRVLAYGGLACFAIHACYLYWMKLVRKAIATRMLYRYVRHPQYACWIASGLGLAILWPRFINLYLWLAMTFVYHALAGHEEQVMKDKHGIAYLAYAAGKGMFLPRLHLRAPRFWLSRHGFTGQACMVGALFALLSVSALGCREYSVSKLNLHYPSSLPDVVVVAMNPPEKAHHEVLAEQAARFVSSSTESDGRPPLMVLIWGRGRFRHFLRDAGVSFESSKKSRIPDAKVYLVTASTRPSHSSGIGRESPRRNAALRFFGRRRMERVYYLTQDMDQTAWQELRFTDGPMPTHASVSLL